MWRKHFIGILLFLLIVAGWITFYLSNLHSPNKLLTTNYQSFRGDLNFTANKADEISSLPIDNEDEKHEWRPATYQGLTIGKSTRADMIRVLGQPLSSSPSAEQDEPRVIIWNDYGMIRGELSGRLGVEVNSQTNRIISITISTDNMSKEKVIKYFGDDYQMMGYSFCEGQPDDWTYGLVYENPKSTDIDYIEYRSKGIAIHLDYQGKVDDIYFIAKPLGLTSKEDCKKEIAKLKRKSTRR